MVFHLFDLSTWPRASHYHHFAKDVPCTICLTADVELGELKEVLRRTNRKFYPTMIWLLTTVVHRHPELRMALDAQGLPGWYETVHPCYTVFHPENETFTTTWTPWQEDYFSFYLSAVEDMAAAQAYAGYEMPGIPENILNLSCLPWLEYQSFSMNIPQGERPYLAPILTWGKYRENAGQCCLPLSIQIHHAAADGYHLSRFYAEVSQEAKRLAQMLCARDR